MNHFEYTIGFFLIQLLTTIKRNNLRYSARSCVIKLNIKINKILFALLEIHVS